MLRSGMVVLTTLVVVSAAAASRAAAQRVNDGTGGSDITATDVERYLRYLAIQDTVEDFQWSLRPFSESEHRIVTSSLSGGPWQGRGITAGSSLAEARVLPVSAGLRFNSAFPYSNGNDGAVWAGRGITTVLQGGVFARLGPLSLRLEPILFRADNSNFDVGFGAACPPICETGPAAGIVDLVQRFGSRSYARLDPGNSSLTLDLFHATAGITTANESWGPSESYPFLLGPNAPGFPHAFLGTSEPANILVGKLSLRVLYGRLDQSAYSPVQGSKYYYLPDAAGRIRFASGFLAVFKPRGITGLEIGAGRFMHSPWLPTGIPRSYLRKPFRGFLKKPLIAKNFDFSLAALDNELASAFLQWTFPSEGVEVYGEYGRDDHSYDFRDLAQEPDHDRAYSLGLRKAFSSSREKMTGVRFELINYQKPILARTDRGEGNVYVHFTLKQGHTNRGQLLGAPVTAGTGAASTLAYDSYNPAGGWSVKWERIVRQEEGDFYQTGNVNPKSSDVIHSLGIERTKVGKSVDVRGALSLMREFNRNFVSDATNLNFAVTLTRHSRR